MSSSFLQKMKHAPNNMLAARPGHGINGHGLAGFLVDKAERYAGTAAFGYAKGYYGDRFMWKDQGADLWLGALLTGAGAFLNAYSSGNSKIAPHLERFGDAGVQAWIHSWAVGKGTSSSGRHVQVLNPGQGAPRLSGDILGHIPQAQGGAYLTPEEMAQHSQPR